VRGKIAEAAVNRKPLIKAIANFVKDVLPNTTLVDTSPKRESVELATQTQIRQHRHHRMKLPLVVLDLVVPLQLPLMMMFMLVKM
jgi:hypothetical protein